MTKKLGWRAGIVAFLVLGALIYLTPSFMKALPPWWSTILPNEKIHLGLDLQGGVHLVLEVEAKKAVESNLERVLEELKHDLRKEKLRYLELKREGTEGISLTLMRDEDGKILQDLIKANYPDLSVKRGGGAERGVVFDLILNEKAKNQIMRMATDQALETIRNRVDQFGVSEPDIRPQQDFRILIQLNQCPSKLLDASGGALGCRTWPLAGSPHIRAT